ncbi:NUDIX domain-containing protein [Celeribacter halophilus]|uniref:NUDIX domain-containing protein n=1 Tax=Celeribacter halophilus TaxID=576117 RepID=UPI003A950845
MVLSDPFSPLGQQYSPDQIAFLRAVIAGDEPFLTPEFVAAAAQEVALYHGNRSVEEIRPLRPMIFTRAWASLNAARATRPRAPDRVDMARTDVTSLRREIPYSYFFAVDDSTIRHRQFDGDTSQEMTRAAFLMADAVTVLPYDPLRDRVLVIEQFRFGPYARGDARPWMLEPIAGRVDAGEGTEATARREGEEEAGVKIGALHKVAEYYPSSGAITEYVTSYIGICDLPDGITQTGGGLEEEHEDIASYLLSYDRLMEMCDAGQLDVGPLYLSALWLSRHRDRIKREAGL